MQSSSLPCSTLLSLTFPHPLDTTCLQAGANGNCSFKASMSSHVANIGSMPDRLTSTWVSYVPPWLIIRRWSARRGTYRLLLYSGNWDTNTWSLPSAAFNCDTWKLDAMWSVRQLQFVSNRSNTLKHRVRPKELESQSLVWSGNN